MLKLDHLTVPVSDWVRSRDWYVGVLGLKVEFEVPERVTVAAQDQCGFTIFFVQSTNVFPTEAFAFTFQVSDVHASFEGISRRGGKFSHPPAKLFWGYGAELRDPDGFVVRLWDEKSMSEKG